MRDEKRCEQGIALVTTLLAVALLMVVVMEFAYATQVDFHLAYNAQAKVQSVYLARSGVHMAQLILEDDARKSGLDTLNEDWARSLPPLPIGQGVVTVQVQDEQGKLNLNALRNANGTINGAWREVAERLFAVLELDIGLLDPVLDWLDADDFPEPRGAEAASYKNQASQNQASAYTPRNDILLTLGELSRVRGFTPAIQATLYKSVTVLPKRNTKINVNTAPRAVLAALFPSVEAQALDAFMVSRIRTPIRGVTELRERFDIPPEEGLDVRHATVHSNFFSVRALASVAQVNHVLRVVMQRRAAKVVLLSWYESSAPSNPTNLTGPTQVGA